MKSSFFRFWALNIKAGADFETNSVYYLFNICIVLTEIGFQHIKDIVKATFDFFYMLFKHKNLEKFYNECQCLAARRFLYKHELPAFDNVFHVVSGIKYFKEEDILNGRFLFYEYNEDLIKHMLNLLMSMKCNLMISSHQNYKNIPYDRTEKWFGVKYATLDMTQDWADIMAINPRKVSEFFLYEPAKIKSYLNIFPADELIPLYPEQLIDTNICEMWFKQDNKFKLPYVYVHIFLKSPVASESAKK